MLPHFAGRAPDGTTPAVRFFRRTFPDLFETVFSQIEALPRPRQRTYHGGAESDIITCPALSGYPFFVRLRLESQRGCSPTALHGVMQTLEATILATATAWEQDGIAAGEMREIRGAVDETFLEQMILVFQDVPSGYICRKVADDRTYATWKAVVDARRTALGTGVLLVSDRAKALIQLAEHGLECLSMPDFFPLVHEIVKSYALAIGRRVRPAQQDLKHAEQGLARRQEPGPQAGP